MYELHVLEKEMVCTPKQFSQGYEKLFSDVYWLHLNASRLGRCEEFGLSYF